MEVETREISEQVERQLIQEFQENERNARETRKTILNAARENFLLPPDMLERMLKELETFGGIRGGLMWQLGLTCKSTAIDPKERTELLLEMI